MIDESDTEEDGRLSPAHCMIAESSITSHHCMKPSLTNHNSDSFNRTFMPLPISLKNQTSLDKSIHGTVLHPSMEEISPAKKGFSSITITARRYIASLSHAPKEITTDPAPSLCRYNDLLMKASVSSDEHDQQCRYLDSAEDYTRDPEPCEFFRSQELPRQPVVDKTNTKLFISRVHIKKDHMFPGSIYYIDRSFFLPLGQIANPRTYKSTIYLKIQPRLVWPTGNSRCETPALPAYALCCYLTMPATDGNNKCKADQTQPPKPNREIQCTQYKEHRESQEEQKNVHDHEACQDVSSYPNIKAGHKSCENNGGENNMPLPEISENNISTGSSREITNLQEALKYLRPDFISNSQRRVQKLELMEQQRKSQKEGTATSSPIYLKNKMFTVPHPLSDNLFKPKDRVISEREMQQRSRRIYSSLPEVRKKKEDEEKRMITKKNILQAQIFKKKLLDHILQRSTD